MQPVLTLPDSLLRPDLGQITYLSALRPGPDAGTWAISVPLLPFSADDEFDSATFRPGVDGPVLIQTEVRLDFIELPGEDLAALAGRGFEFPANPAAGYVDGSIYLEGTHNAVDVTRIEFRIPRGDRVDAVLHLACVREPGVETERPLPVVLRYTRVS